MATSPSVVIIGAGLGGLAASIYLARAGARVTVYEKNQYPGGKAGVIREHGFRFDTGPSLLTMPFVLEDIFTHAGKKLQDYLTLQKLQILCRYFYPDGTVLNAFSDPERFAEEIDRVSKDSRHQVIRYLEYCKKIYERTADLFLFKDFRQLKDIVSLSALKTLLNIQQIDPFRTMHSANASFFTDPKVIQLFDRYATYNGSDPYRVPATLNIIQHVEYNLGGYIVKEGIHRIPAALMEVARELGVSFHFGTKVVKIRHKQGIVTGITTGNTTTDYDCIVSNIDAGFTYTRLLDDVKCKDARRYFKQEPSSSALVFYWGIKGRTEQLETHNIFFSKNYQAEFNDIFGHRMCPDDPTVYVYVSSRFQETDAPAGHENWFVMINTPYNSGQDWPKETRRMRKIITDKLSSELQKDIDEIIVFEKTLTPVTIERETGSLFGSLYGISSNSRFAAFLRQRNASRDWKGLYFCGGSAHPGGGMPLVMLSGKITAEKIIKKYGNQI
jgi:phytoene desaturase